MSVKQYPMPHKTSNKPAAPRLELSGPSHSGAATDKALLSAATKQAYKRVNLLLNACKNDAGHTC